MRRPIWKNLPPVLTKQLYLLSSVKTMLTNGRFLKKIVAFSEKLNFKKIIKHCKKTHNIQRQTHNIQRQSEDQLPGLKTSRRLLRPRLITSNISWKRGYLKIVGKTYNIQRRSEDQLPGLNTSRRPLRPRLMTSCPGNDETNLRYWAGSRTPLKRLKGCSIGSSNASKMDKKKGKFIFREQLWWSGIKIL